MKSSNSHPSRIIPNPFILELKLTTVQKIQIGLMSLTVFPVRCLLVACSMMLVWVFTVVGVMGRSESVIGPETFWKRIFDLCVRMSLRALWFCFGFHWLKVKGQKADPSDAPILVVAPHSSVFDAIPISETLCTLITKESNKHVPLLGTIGHYVIPVYVSREDRDSRKRAVEEIKRRAKSGGQWPQLVIFPEATSTNRSGLILFKPGAFIPGLPVQPVLLRFPNKLDISWSWRGPGMLKILWLRMCQFHNSFEIEYLPVYTPSQEEKENPSLFANNVRKLMAKELAVPLIDVSYDDADVVLSSGPLGIFNFSCLLEFNQLVRRLELKYATNASVLEEQARKARKLQGELFSVQDFAQILGLPVSDTLKQLHSMFDQKENGLIDYRHYVIALSSVCQSKPKENLKLAFKIYQNEEDGSVTEEDLATILEIMLGVENMDLSGLFLALEEDTGQITYDQLCQFVDQHPDFVHNYLRFTNHPASMCCIGRAQSDGYDQKKRE